jgi:tripartite-type tricarboxylate transporter receptor subunit TctC
LNIFERMLMAVVCIATAAAPSALLAQTYPAKPVRVLVPFPAASIPDIVARLVTDKIGGPLGQPVIVENRIGAGGRIAASAAAKAAPDGYTLLLGSTSTQVVAPYVVKDMPYDPMRDFTPIANAASVVTGLVVHASVPVGSVSELVGYAKKNPGKISYGSNGIGSTHHIRGELVKMAAGIDIVHVPYSGSNELMNAIVGGQLQMTFFAPGALKQHIAAGKVRLLAVTTAKRVSELPDVPALVESLPDYEPFADWFAFFGPAGLAPAVVSRLNREIAKALEMADVRARLGANSLQVIASSPEELAETIRNDSKIFAKAVKAAGIEPR